MLLTVGWVVLFGEVDVALVHLNELNSLGVGRLLIRLITELNYLFVDLRDAQQSTQELLSFYGHNNFIQPHC